jgi:hypothetical protein
MRRVNGLAGCAQAVMQAAEEMREASAGTVSSASASAETGFEHERVAAHLEAAAAALEASTVAVETCAATASRLRELATEVRAADSAPKSASGSPAPVDLESLERTLTVHEACSRPDRAGWKNCSSGPKEHAARTGAIAAGWGCSVAPGGAQFVQTLLTPQPSV